jgi:hypothetical protein
MVFREMGWEVWGECVWNRLVFKNPEILFKSTSHLSKSTCPYIYTESKNVVTIGDSSHLWQVDKTISETP